MFIISIIFALISPIFINRWLERKHRDAVKYSEGTQYRKVKLVRGDQLTGVLFLMHIMPTAILLGIGVGMLDAQDTSAFEAVLTVLLVLAAIISSALYLSSQGDKLAKIAALYENAPDSPQSSPSNKESTVSNEPKYHEWIKSIYSGQE